MSYHSVGLMKDMLELPIVTESSFGYATGGSKFRLGRAGKAGSDKNPGNTKVADQKILRAYIKSGGVAANMNMYLPEKEQLTLWAICSRFKTAKRFYIWVAHAWMRKRDRVQTRRTKSGAFWGNNLFVINEKRIAEWIEHLHENPTSKCKKCRGSGLVITPNKNYLWEYCSCSRGKLRRRCFLTADGWYKAKSLFCP